MAHADELPMNGGNKLQSNIYDINLCPRKVLLDMASLTFSFMLNNWVISIWQNKNYSDYRYSVINTFATAIDTWVIVGYIDKLYSLGIISIPRILEIFHE